MCLKHPLPVSETGLKKWIKHHTRSTVAWLTLPTLVQVAYGSNLPPTCRAKGVLCSASSSQQKWSICWSRGSPEKLAGDLIQKAVISGAMRR